MMEVKEATQALLMPNTSVRRMNKGPFIHDWCNWAVTSTQQRGVAVSGEPLSVLAFLVIPSLFDPSLSLWPHLHILSLTRETFALDFKCQRHLPQRSPPLTGHLCEATRLPALLALAEDTAGSSVVQGASLSTAACTISACCRNSWRELRVAT